MGKTHGDTIINPQDDDVATGNPRGSIPSGKPVVHDTGNKDMLREEQKKRGQYPLHDEPIGGA
jgi:hypothetical protein